MLDYILHKKTFVEKSRKIIKNGIKIYITTYVEEAN